MILDPITFMCCALGKKIKFDNKNINFIRKPLYSVSVEKYISINMNFELDDLNIKKSSLFGSPGIYIPYEDEKVTIGTLNTRCGYFLSDNFGGCDFALLQRPDGRFAAAHIYSSEKCRTFMNTLPPHWKCLYIWRSLPYAKMFGLTSGLMCLCFINNMVAEFILFSIKGYPAKISSVTRCTQFRIHQ